MQRFTLSIFMLYCTISISCQRKTISPFNFNFEQVTNNIPDGWGNFGSANYLLGLDSINAYSGKYAASIECREGTSDFKAWAFTIPNTYDGKKITLTGYVKTENVTEGYAGLWLRIDPSIAFDNMSDRGVKGSTDWTKYEITLDMNPAKTTQIVFGGLLVGKGKMWLDDLHVSIDGQDIAALKPLEKKIYPAELDKEFENGSQISSIRIDKSQIQNLKALGLIWGFLKYHHPSIAEGKYNWDYALFRILPKLLEAKNKKDRDQLISDWIVNLGSFVHGQVADLNLPDVKLKPDLDWINNLNFSDTLTKLLLDVKNASRTNEHYYIDLHPGVKNPDFKNERAYSSMDCLDVGYRLLTLFRYWNIIQYYFPYKNLIEEDWKNVLEEFIPKIVQADTKTNYTLTVLELIGRVHDTHANVWGKNEALNDYLGLRYAPIELTFIEDQATVTAYYDNNFGKETGLLIGDVILAINNIQTKKLIQEILKYTPASNYATQLRDIAAKLLRSNDSTINVEYLRDGRVENKTIKTYSSNAINIYRKHQNQDTCFKLIHKDIAYLNHGTLKRAYLPEIWNEIKNTKGLIIDIRNYPSDFPLYELSASLMPDSKPFVEFTHGSIENPGLFTFSKTLNAGEKNDDYYKGKVVILVNELSQSSAEFHSMAYRQHPHATVIGSTTAGADGNVSQFSLPGGIKTMISGIGVYYPDRKETQRIGIVPDIEIKPTLQGIKSGADELISKAIEFINGK